MKTICTLTLSLVIVGCATAPQPKVALPPPSLPTSGLRYPELIHPYHLGRAVDPGDSRLMREAHPIYRVETDARWDFHPGSGGTTPKNASIDPAFQPPPLDGASIAELHHQRLISARLLRETERLAKAHEALQGLVDDLTKVARDHGRTQERLRALEERLAGSSTPPAAAEAPFPESRETDLRP